MKNSFLKLSTALVCVLFSGCAGSAQYTNSKADAAYRQAIVSKEQGDSRAFYAAMTHLASDAPDTRAGRRAQAILVGTDLTTSFMFIGIGAAVVVPALQGFLSETQRLKNPPELESYEEDL